MDHQQPPPPPHLLVVTFPAQGHLNPALHLAKRLARSTTARVTFSTALAAHSRMFPSSSEFVDADGITYIPFADGSGGSSSLHNPNNGDLRQFVTQMKLLGSHHLASILRDLAARGRPVSCVVYTIMLQWAGDVARELGIPSVLYWIQAATVLSIYHHFFNGYEPLHPDKARDPSFSVSLPGLPPFQIRDLPSFLTITSPDEPFYDILDAFRQVFDALRGGPKPKILVNTFDELERGVLASMEEHMELLTVGPVIPEDPETKNTPSAAAGEEEYMEWLDKQEERSVVYAAFGSVHKMSGEEMEETWRALRESRRPFLWVVRKESRGEGVGLELEENGKGMVVEWCAQLRVLSHRAVGCFVTHCGWNSTVEGLVCGAPAVALPKWSDQGTNAWLMEREWGTAVRAETGEDGRVAAGELRRCVEVVMGEGGVEIRRKAEMWKERARAAIGGGGSSERNLKALVKGIASTEISYPRMH